MEKLEADVRKYRQKAEDTEYLRKRIAVSYETYSVQYYICSFIISDACLYTCIYTCTLYIHVYICIYMYIVYTLYWTIIRMDVDVCV